jgi:phosphotransferase system  glucose/maltose/N-acetylglucosamine-specific IIC component
MEQKQAPDTEEKHDEPELSRKAKIFMTICSAFVTTSFVITIIDFIMGRRKLDLLEAGWYPWAAIGILMIVAVACYAMNEKHGHRFPGRL